MIEDHNFCKLILEPICFKSINLTCINNFLINQKTRFTKTVTFKTGLSDHYRLINTILKSKFAKEKPNKIFQRFNRNFDNEKFERKLKKQLLLLSNFEFSRLAFKFTLNQFAPLKQKVVSFVKFFWRYLS